MAYRMERTLADVIAGALSPPLIMTLVGSLIFFLLEILYQGMYMGVLQWVLFFFVMGAVLIARIAMQADISNRAGMYGLVLGGLVWLALQTYVQYGENPALAQRGGLINLGLIALIWWSAHRLTWECTFIDDDQAGDGMGLLEVVGLEKTDRELPAEEPTPSPKELKAEPPGLMGWWERYCRFREKRRQRPHTPGVWIVLFSLAALPLFGLGQAQISPDDWERRRYAFKLLVLYVGSGLGLLLTTSFLGLRCYLRKRKVTMPLELTFIWLFLGAVLIVIFLIVGDLLPKPADRQPGWAWTGLFGSGEFKPSPSSPFQATEQNKKEVQDDAKEKSSPDLAKGGEKKSGQEPKPSPGPKDQGKQAGKDSQEKQQSPEKKAEEKPSEDQKKEDTPPDPAKKKEKGATLPTFLGPLMDLLIKVSRWVIIALVIGVITFWVLRAVLQFLANFTFWAHKLLTYLENLWENLRPGRKTEKVGDEEPSGPTPRAFASFASPFLSGQAEYLSPAQLVRYSFAALEAWAREQDLARDPSQTPLEFAHSLQADFPELAREAGKLAQLYARLAYSTASLPQDTVNGLRNFWKWLLRSGKQVASGEE